MKIAVADNNGQKFIRDVVDHWESLGHEVHVEPGASEKLTQWADLYFLDTWDNNIHYLYKLYHGDPGGSRTWMKDWDNNKKPFICVRILDWETWIGLVRDQDIINWVDKAICIAPHIEQKLRAENEWGAKLKLIKPGVNLDKFTLKTKQTDGFQLGMCLGDLWKMKNHYQGMDIFLRLYKKDKRWRLHIRGQHESSIYDPEYWEYFLDSRNIRDVVTLYPHIEGSMNDWYENIDILLHPGQKEAFCYAVGEALAKGIPVVVNDFLGAKDIWPESCLYEDTEEAINRIKEINNKSIQTFKPENYRKYIEDTYNMKKMLKDFYEFLEI